jgi:eukaryotic-like serine/threonine-protein kinase
VERVLGEGGMGLVYEGLHEALGRKVALKLLRPEFASNPEVVRRFLQEAKAANVIDNDNIVEVYDYGTAPDGGVYFVMEYLDGETLEAMLARLGALPMPLFVHLAGQILRALVAAHAKAIVHRDLKPQNVFIVRRERNPAHVKLLDFGIAKVRGAAGNLAQTSAGAIMGTPQYMSPEQIYGQQDLDARSDIFSLGIILYRAASGVMPFEGSAFAELAPKIVYETPPAPSAAAPTRGLPASLDAVIMRALQKDRAARFTSAADMLVAFDEVRRELGLDEASTLEQVRRLLGVRDRLDFAPAHVPVTAPAAPAPAPKPRGSRKALLAGGVLAAVAAAGVTIYAASAHKAPAIARADAGLAPAVPPPAPTIASLWAAGDTVPAQALARTQLSSALAGDDADEQRKAIEAVAEVRPPQAAPLLYGALERSPDLRVRAAEALRELGDRAALPALRQALAASGGRVKVQIAAQLAGLGDSDAVPLLEAALGDPSVRVVAAAALLPVRPQHAQKVLVDVLEQSSGSEAWLQAADALFAAGDETARSALTAELAQSDVRRQLAAARLLARRGEEQGKRKLVELLAGPAARRGEAAVALASAGGADALTFVDTGLASVEASDRWAAAAVCGLLARAGGQAYGKRVAALATSDPDARVRLVAAASLLSM